jgi:hypothetical protein
MRAEAQAKAIATIAKALTDSTAAEAAKLAIARDVSN